jgi:DNA-binding NarL/FixJ family response regulator
MIRVLLIDDHPIVRQGLRHLIDAEPDLNVVGEAGDTAVGATLLGELRPNVAIIDLNLPNPGSIDLVRFCRQLQPAVAPLILTMHREESTFRDALERGAAGYVLKENASSDVLLGIRAVAAGGMYLSPSIAGFLSRWRDSRDAHANPSRIDPLTPTERRVLRLIAANRTTKEIAHELCISPRTIDTHRAHISEKLGLRGAQALLRFALENRADL